MTRDRTTAEVAALEALDSGAVVNTASDLIAVPSFGGNETPAQEHVIGLMRGIGMDVDAWDIDLDAMRRHPRLRMEIEREHAIGVVGSFGGGDGPVLVLNGHVDVEPAGDLERWTVPPFAGTIAGGRLHGRGSCDMKGAVAAALMAVRAIRDAGVRLAGSVAVQSVVGEEDGGLGTVATLERGHTGDAAIVMEPTAGAIAPALAGAAGFEVTLTGRPAHGSLRGEGVNPIEGFMQVHHALRRLETERNRPPHHPMFEGNDLPYPLSIGVLRTGERPSSVPDQLLFAGRLGIRVGEEPEAAQADFKRAVFEGLAGDAWHEAKPPLVAWPGGAFRSAETPADAPIVDLVRRACRDEHGEDPALRGMPYGADMHWLVHDAGIPTVLYGPGDIRQAHAPDEYVVVDELVGFARTLVRLIVRYCGTR